jgi:hypothetical protein
MQKKIQIGVLALLTALHFSRMPFFHPYQQWFSDNHGCHFEEFRETTSTQGKPKAP